LIDVPKYVSDKIRHPLIIQGVTLCTSNPVNIKLSTFLVGITLETDSVTSCIDHFLYYRRLMTINRKIF